MSPCFYFLYTFHLDFQVTKVILMQLCQLGEGEAQTQLIPHQKIQVLVFLNISLQEIRLLDTNI